MKPGLNPLCSTGRCIGAPWAQAQLSLSQFRRGLLPSAESFHLDLLFHGLLSILPFCSAHLWELSLPLLLVNQSFSHSILFIVSFFFWQSWKELWIYDSRRRNEGEFLVLFNFRLNYFVRQLDHSWCEEWQRWTSSPYDLHFCPHLKSSSISFSLFLL